MERLRIEWEVSMYQYSDEQIRVVNRAVRRRSVLLVGWYIRERPDDWERNVDLMIAQQGNIIVSEFMGF